MCLCICIEIDINQIPPRFGGGAPKAAGPAPTATFAGGGLGFAIQPARAFAAGDAAGGKGYIKADVCIRLFAGGGARGPLHKIHT